MNPAPPKGLTGHKLAAWKYARSAKGKAAFTRYRKSEKNRIVQARYNRSVAGHDRWKRYSRTFKYKVMLQMYKETKVWRHRHV